VQTSGLTGRIVRSAIQPAAALQHNSPHLPPHDDTAVTSPDKPREVFIQGITRDGRSFRPSDWAERLAGAMSSFRPGGTSAAMGRVIGYSPYCIPTTIGNVKCVIVNEALRDLEPMAWDFVMNFARDNELQVSKTTPAPPAKPAR
jgi:hypothetical protein